jgi:hypothetical protein
MQRPIAGLFLWVTAFSDSRHSPIFPFQNAHSAEISDEQVMPELHFWPEHKAATPSATWIKPSSADRT